VAGKAVNLGGYLLTIRSLFPSRPQQTKTGRIELNDTSVRTAAMTIDAVHLVLFPGIALQNRSA
jgi:hypothetical protein